jgi:hypothetical protein
LNGAKCLELGRAFGPWLLLFDDAVNDHEPKAREKKFLQIQANHRNCGEARFAGLR